MLYSYLVDEDLVVDQKHFNGKYTSSPKTTNHVAGHFLCSLLDALGDITRWEEDLDNVEI